MSDLGNRSSVTGPQPIGERFVVPPAMLAAAENILELLAQGQRAELETLVAAKATGELGELLDALAPGAYQSHEIIAHAKANNHYYLKARLFGARAAPFTLQLRLGEHAGRWIIWEAVNLSGGRTAWTR
ncbi:MAG TPA: hypothetical protein VNF28_02675 [Candidatus Binataceae bacterium]|nr:hypothetical protein [Candidatus Binataceae bacterium]